jgi:hypothetical protein
MLNIFPRVWDPQNTQNGPADSIKPNTGSFIDQHGNFLDVLAAANPNNYYKPIDLIKPASKYDLGTGYGIVKINKADRRYTFTAWPINADPAKPNAKPYDGWPISFNQNDNDGRTPVGFLQEQRADINNPVVSLISESSGKLIYAKRLQQSTFIAPVYDKKISYTLKFSNPETGYEKSIKNLRVVDTNL